MRDQVLDHAAKTLPTNVSTLPGHQAEVTPIEQQLVPYHGTVEPIMKKGFMKLQQPQRRRTGNRKCQVCVSLSRATRANPIR